MEATSKKQLLIQNLREMLGELFEQKRSGVPMSRLARAHGYVDGYMRVLLDSQIATKDELLSIVSAERVSHDGPALSVRDASTLEETAATIAA